MITKELEKQLCTHEGYRRMPYRDTKQVLTCGYGYNLEANTFNLSKEELAAIHATGMEKDTALRLLRKLVDISEAELIKAFSWFPSVDRIRKDTLINMHYNLGIVKLKKFKKTLTFIANEDYAAAGVEMLNSDWAKQVGNRAVILATQMKTGKYAK